MEQTLTSRARNKVEWDTHDCVSPYFCTVIVIINNNNVIKVGAYARGN